MHKNSPPVPLFPFTVESESEFGWAQKSRSTEQGQRYKYSKIDENLQGKGPKTPEERAHKEQVAVWKAKQLQQRMKAQKNQLFQAQQQEQKAQKGVYLMLCFVVWLTCRGLSEGGLLRWQEQQTCVSSQILPLMLSDFAATLAMHVLLK